MKKRIILTLACLIILIAIIGGVKALQIRAMIDQGKKFSLPPETVTSSPVKADSWDTSLSAVGTLNAVQGVTVAAEMAGKIVSIGFESGSYVKKGDVLIRQDTSSEEAQLPGAEVQVTLARTNFERASVLLDKGIISKSDRDNAVAAVAQAESQAENIRATIAKKNVKAPFSGRLGIRLVNLGQVLREGDPIVTLQSLDPIFADFALPEQQLHQVRTGLPVKLTSDASPGLIIEGRITAVNSQVDQESRNIRVRATVSNKAEKLMPGMFVNVSVGQHGRRNVLVIPATAVSYAPYGDSVFVIEEGKDGKAGKTLRQQFVRLGEKRGDLVSVADGLKAGDTIVSTGVFKLRNGQSVVIDNKLAPAFEKQPKPENN
ncbi:MAG: efflux RND transporter periplasmic adaptor subunit [Nitrospirae bacterium]|nr:efflux RND transporter periplasmic adaptor subunit [Nitrospirota bacterium]